MAQFAISVKDQDNNEVYRKDSATEDQAREDISFALYNWGMDRHVARNIAEGVLLKMKLRRVDWFLAACINEISFEVYKTTN